MAIVRRIRRLAAIAAAAVLADAAAAQEPADGSSATLELARDGYFRQFPSDAQPLIRTVTKESMTYFFREAGYDVAVEREDENAVILRENVEGGGAFYAALVNCDAGACGTVELFAFFNPEGVTLSTLNAAHQSVVVGSTILLQETDGVISRRIFLQGGVSFENLTAQMDVFLADADDFVASISPVAASGVSFPGAQSLASGGKIAAFGARGAAAPSFSTSSLVPDPVVNAVGANAPRLRRRSR